MTGETKDSDGFYCDANGRVCSCAVAPDGYHFSFKEAATYRQVWIIDAESGEVFEEYVWWSSLQAMADGGVDVSTYCEEPAPRV